MACHLLLLSKLMLLGLVLFGWIGASCRGRGMGDGEREVEVIGREGGGREGRE